MSENVSRRSSVSQEEFLKVYVPLAKEGKSAKEIAQVMSTPERQWSDKDVTNKATQIRAQYREVCEAKKLDAEKTNVVLENFVPKLKGTSRSTNSLSVDVDSFLTSLG